MFRNPNVNSFLAALVNSLAFEHIQGSSNVNIRERFPFLGQRFRQSLETSDWREAQAKEKELIARASQGKLAPLSQQFSKLIFKEAGEKNLAERSAHLAPRSVQTERERLKLLCSVFGPVKVLAFDPCGRSRGGAKSRGFPYSTQVDSRCGICKNRKLANSMTGLR